MQITVNPPSIDFGALASGEGATGTVKTVEAPADAQVIATIRGDDASFFNVNSVSSYEWVLRPVDPGDLPPGYKGHPKERVLELAGQTDGKTPLRVSKGQIVEVEIAAVAPPVSDKANFNAQLLIQGDTWGDPAAVNLSMLYGHVEIVPDSLQVGISQVEPGSVTFSLTLTDGPTPTGISTRVFFELANWTTDAVVTFAGDNSPVIVGPQHTTVPAKRRFQLSGPQNSGFFHLAATAFDKRQSKLLVFQIV